MLTLTVPKQEFFDESKGKFFYTKEQTFQIEHSLISLSKWEAKWHKPFIGNDKKTREESVDYIKCMSLTKGLDNDFYESLPDQVMRQIDEYIEDPMTATTINEKDSFSRDIITSEIIYYWMIELGIPFECQKWHLNRLMMLIRVCEIKRGPKKKMSQKKFYKEIENSMRLERNNIAPKVR